MKIYKRRNFNVNNLISCRVKGNPKELRSAYDSLINYVASCEAKKAGNVISVIYASDNETRVSEMGIYLPVDKKIPSSNNFCFLPGLILKKCLVVKHKGVLRFIPNSYKALLDKAESIGCTIKMPIYNVFVSEFAMKSHNFVEIDIYAEYR